MHKVKVLLVEDDDSVRQLLSESLQSRTVVSVDTARDGVEALHQISTTRYDVVILDVMMPKMSGIDFLDSLKALTSDPSVKSMERPPAVIVITGASDAALPDSAIERRYPQVIRAVFRKPLDVERLGSCVERLR